MAPPYTKDSMLSAADDDEDSALDIAEQTNRPEDTDFNQQRIPAWSPILDPVWVIVALFYLGIIMVPVGFKIDSIQASVVELMTTYEDYNAPDDVEQICPIGDEFNANKNCTITFTAPRLMTPPILIHYQLTNFHQNHRSYFKSRDDYQLLGRVTGQDTISAENCQPLNKLGNITLNPCGLIANTFFNDNFELTSGVDVDGKRLRMLETGIAWKTEIEHMYAQPEGFDYGECPGACDATCCEGDDWSCDMPYQEVGEDGSVTCYRYFYPFDNETQYLHETYGNIISPLEGVTNEHFIVWMRVATQEKFRKLYGWIDQTIPAGMRITFRINANYAVTPFRGSKTLIMGTTSIFGGRNPYVARFFIGVGFFCLAAGAFFTLKHTIRPRRLGDRAYLHLKSE